MRPFRMQGLQLRPLGPGCAPRPRMRPAGPPRAQPTAQLPPRPAPGRGPRGDPSPWAGAPGGREMPPAPRALEPQPRLRRVRMEQPGWEERSQTLFSGLLSRFLTRYGQLENRAPRQPEPARRPPHNRAFPGSWRRAGAGLTSHCRRCGGWRGRCPPRLPPRQTGPRGTRRPRWGPGRPGRYRLRTGRPAWPVAGKALEPADGRRAARDSRQALQHTADKARGGRAATPRRPKVVSQLA